MKFHEIPKIHFCTFNNTSQNFTKFRKLKFQKSVSQYDPTSCMWYVQRSKDITRPAFKGQYTSAARRSAQHTDLTEGFIYCEVPSLLSINAGREASYKCFWYFILVASVDGAGILHTMNTDACIRTSGGPGNRFHDQIELSPLNTIDQRIAFKAKVIPPE